MPHTISITVSDAHFAFLASKKPFKGTTEAHVAKSILEDAFSSETGRIWIWEHEDYLRDVELYQLSFVSEGFIFQNDDERNNHKTAMYVFDQHKNFGKGWTVLGKELGIHPQNAKAAFHRGQDLAKRSESFALDRNEIKHSPMPIRCVNALRNNGVSRFDELSTVTRNQILDTPNFGIKSLAILEGFLKAFQIEASFKPE